MGQVVVVALLCGSIGFGVGLSMGRMEARALLEAERARFDERLAAASAEWRLQLDELQRWALQQLADLRGGR